MAPTTNLLRLTAGLLFGLLVLTACEYREVDGVGTRTYDEQYVPQDDISAFTGCSMNGLGQWQPAGTVTNNTPDMATYAVTVAFFDGDTRVDERTMWIRDLHPGEQAQMNRAWWLNNGDSVGSCDILTIDRFTTPIVE